MFKPSAQLSLQLCAEAPYSQSISPEPCMEALNSQSIFQGPDGQGPHTLEDRAFMLHDVTVQKLLIKIWSSHE